MINTPINFSRRERMTNTPWEEFCARASHQRCFIYFRMGFFFWSFFLFPADVAPSLQRYRLIVVVLLFWFMFFFILFYITQIQSLQNPKSPLIARACFFFTQIPWDVAGETCGMVPFIGCGMNRNRMSGTTADKEALRKIFIMSWKMMCTCSDYNHKAQFQALSSISR